MIPIKSMASNEEHLYVCRKGFHAINVQGVCDHKMKFTHIYCRFGGAYHDAFIMSASSIEDLMKDLPGEGWLLGDSGYPLKPWLMTPLANPTTPSERRYQVAHSTTRNIIERAFGVLKGRFRCLHKRGGFLGYSPEKCVKIIEACMKLHNKAIEEKLPLPPLAPTYSDTSTSDSVSTHALQIRQNIITTLALYVDKT